MTLPIIIVLERHWDVEAKEAVEKSLASLQLQGFDTLCFEAASDNSEKIAADVKSTINFIEANYAKAMALLKSKGIHEDLSKLDYSVLERLLLNHVSSRFSHEMALWFKELPGHKKKLGLIETSKSMGMSVLGVDLVKSEIEPLNSFEAQENLTKRTNIIEALDPKRIAAFKENVLSLQQKGKGVIFVVGHRHYEKLVKAFREHSLAEIIFAHPHSPRCFDKAIDDRSLTPIWDNDLTLISMAIDNPNDSEAFSIALNEAVIAKMVAYKAIEPTILSRLLVEKSGLPFEPYLRPSMYVDAYCPVKGTDDIIPVVKKLEQSGIQGSFTFFGGKQTYCIPCINSTEVGEAITKFNPKDKEKAEDLQTSRGIITSLAG